MELRTIHDALNAEPGVYIVHEDTQIAVLTITRDGGRTAIERQELGTSIRLHQLAQRFAADDALASTPPTGGVGANADEPYPLPSVDDPLVSHITAALDAAAVPPADADAAAAPAEQNGHAAAPAFVCEDCGKTFRNEHGLGVHRARMHSSRASAPDAPAVPTVVVLNADAQQRMLENEADALLALVDEEEPNPSTPQPHWAELGQNESAAFADEHSALAAAGH